MVKATMDEGKSRTTEVKVARKEKRVKRVESEETRGHARESRSTDQEEVEGLSFVPSAISVPQKLLFRCDNLCSEKTLNCWKLALVVIMEGEEFFTTRKMPEMLQRVSEGKRRKHTDKCAVERVRGTKGAPWKALENDWKRSICTWHVGIFSPRKISSKHVSRTE